DAFAEAAPASSEGSPARVRVRLRRRRGPGARRRRGRTADRPAERGREEAGQTERLGLSPGLEAEGVPAGEGCTRGAPAVVVARAEARRRLRSLHVRVDLPDRPQPRSPGDAPRYRPDAGRVHPLQLPDGPHAVPALRAAVRGRRRGETRPPYLTRSD